MDFKLAKTSKEATQLNELVGKDENWIRKHLDRFKDSVIEGKVQHQGDLVEYVLSVAETTEEAVVLTNAFTKFSEQIEIIERAKMTAFMKRMLGKD